MEFQSISLSLCEICIQAWKLKYWNINLSYADETILIVKNIKESASTNNKNQEAVFCKTWVKQPSPLPPPPPPSTTRSMILSGLLYKLLFCAVTLKSNFFAYFSSRLFHSTFPFKVCFQREIGLLFLPSVLLKASWHRILNGKCTKAQLPQAFGIVLGTPEAVL